MSTNKPDITIDGTTARIARGQEGAFRERSIRAEITQNVLSQAENAGLISRPDQPALYQSDWSAGSRWWKPIASPQEASSYFTSSNFDLWSEPGKIVPRNTFAVVDNTFPRLWTEHAVTAVLGRELYVIASDTDVDTTHYDVGVWTSASDAFVNATTYHSGVNALSDDGPMAAVGDASDGYVYVITHDSEITRFDPVNDTTDDAWITTGFTASEGANIFLQAGNLMFYSGDQLYTINKSGPSATSVFNDGMGRDILEDAANNGSALNPYWSNLAISTPEGIYYVKNTQQGGSYVAWLFRVDRDEAGNWIGNPLGTLPNGEVALDIVYHLGSVIVSAASDFVVSGAAFPSQVTIYHLTQGSLGALGSPLGKTATISSQVYRFLGTTGPYLFMGPDQVWVYDAVRGGLHPIATGAFKSALQVQDSADDQCVLFIGNGDGRLYKIESEVNPDTVTAFGDDETNYTLESNYFDFSLPMELKDITKVAVMTDAVASANNNEWTLQVSTDDAAFADVLTHSGTAQYAEATITPGTHRGRLFRYKVIYQTKTAIKRALRAVLITANAGQMVREWDVILDGTSMMNIANVVVRPNAFAEAMRAIAAKEAAISVTFNYQDADVSADTSETVNVKVQSCEIIKDKADESFIALGLRGV